MKGGRIVQDAYGPRRQAGEHRNAAPARSLIEPLQAPPRYNGSPGQAHWVIRQNPKTGERSLDRLWWGLIPSWVKDPSGGRKPINAKCETVASLPSFREAYKRWRCLVPISFVR
jgi:putative SOS response-associated peptidase YedK